MKRIAAMAVALGMCATPVLAAEQPSSGPVKLSDADLEQVSGGDGAHPDLFANLNITLKNIAVTGYVSNVPINLGAAAQANALGQAIQSATVIAGHQLSQA